MSALIPKPILSVHHWNDALFSFRTTHDKALRFVNGSSSPSAWKSRGGRACILVASANYEHLELSASRCRTAR